MKLKNFALPVLVCLLAVCVFPQSAPEKILEKGDVERFIKTFGPINEDLKQLGAKYDSENQNMNIPEAMLASQEYQNILKKHGWDEAFYQKASAILAGYGLLIQDKALLQAQAAIAQQIKEIDSNSAIPDSMKTQLKQQLLTAQSAMSMQKQGTKDALHPEDMQLIFAKFEELKELLENN